jgi:hypothetical protein
MNTDKNEAIELTGAELRENSICVIIQASRFSVRRTVAKDRVQVDAVGEGPGLAIVDQDQVTVAKDLLDSKELRAVGLYDHYTKQWLRARSVPSPLLRSGAYLISVGALGDVYAYLEARKVGRDALIGQFEESYPALVRAAKGRLGPLFDPSEYPARGELRGMFGMEWQVVEMGTPDVKLRSISQALFEKERDKAERVWTSAVGQINEALAQGMADVVGHIGKPKRFGEKSLARVTEFLGLLDARNLTRNADLTALADKARKLLSGVDAKSLKKDVGSRERLATEFTAIKASLDTMLEARPVRAIALSDEEVL